MPRNVDVDIDIIPVSLRNQVGVVGSRFVLHRLVRWTCESGGTCSLRASHASQVDMLVRWTCWSSVRFMLHMLVRWTCWSSVHFVLHMLARWTC